MGLQHLQFKTDFDSISHYFLCSYHPRSKGSDDLSESLLRFKNGWPIDTAAWIECSVSELKKIVWEPDTVIIRSLRSDELEVVNQDTPLDKLGSRLADELELRYLPELVFKTRSIRKVKMLSRAEREDELEGAYQCKAGMTDFNHVLILDDILTTGTTVRSITLVVRERYPNCRVTVYTLAHTDDDTLLNSYVSLKGFHYHWQPKEGWIVEESHVFYMTLDSLQARIMNNFTDPVEN